MSARDAPLRVALLLDEPIIPWWIAPAVEQMQQRGLGVVVLAVQRSPTGTAPRISRLARWWRNRRVLGHALVERLDRRRAGREPPGSDQPLGELCPQARLLRVDPETTRFGDAIRADDVEQIRGYDLDVMLRLGFRILRGPVLEAARHGVWSFHHGDNRVYRGGPAGVWEVLHSRPESGITLQRLTEELDGGEVLAWWECATQPLSFEKNLRYLLRHSPAMLLRSLERLHEGRDPCQLSALERVPWSGYSHPLYRTPTNGTVARRLLSLAGGYLRQRLRSAGAKLQWSIAWHWRPAPTHDDPHGVFHRYRTIPTPRDRYWADPFVARTGDRWWMFFEEVRYAGGRGEIAVWEMGPQGPVGSPRTVLQQPYHLSYPQVFEYQGRWYMLPETGATNRLELYIADEFPHRWSLHTTMLEGQRIVDATVLEHQSHWYIFASLGSEGLEASENLSAFVGPTPFGPFRPHPANPLVSDVRRARMAGRFFRSEGSLLRPAQTCVPRYGAGIAVHEVLELTPTTYRERLIAELEPRWRPGLLGFHTINCAGGLSVIDCLRLVRG